MGMVVSFDRIILSTETTNTMVKAEKQMQLSQKPAKSQSARCYQQCSICFEIPIHSGYQTIFLGRADVKHLFGISEVHSSVMKAKSSPKISNCRSTRAFQSVCQQALELFEDEAETQRWLSTPKL